MKKVMCTILLAGRRSDVRPGGRLYGIHCRQILLSKDKAMWSDEACVALAA